MVEQFTPETMAKNLFSHIGVELEEKVAKLLSYKEKFLENDDFWNAKGDYENIRFTLKHLPGTFSLTEIFDFVRLSTQNFYDKHAWWTDGGKSFYHEFKNEFRDIVYDFIGTLEQDDEEYRSKSRSFIAVQVTPIRKIS